MSFKFKDMNEWCKEKFPSTETYGETYKENDDMTAAELQKEIAKSRPLTIHGDLTQNLVIKPTRFERKCLVGKDEIPCYFHGWFQLNTPTKDGNSIAYPVGVVEHRDDGVMEQVKVTSIKFVEVFEE